jgi:hypothetical protein
MTTKYAIIDNEVIEVEVLSQQQNYALVRRNGRTPHETKYGDQPVKVVDLFDNETEALRELCKRIKSDRQAEQASRQFFPSTVGVLSPWKPLEREFWK